TGAVLAATLAGYDPLIAQTTAKNAIENNALFGILKESEEEVEKEEQQGTAPSLSSGAEGIPDSDLSESEQKVRKIFNKALQKWIEKTDDFTEARHITSVGAYIGDVLQKEYNLTFEERVRALGHQYSRLRKPRVRVDTPLSQGVDQAKEFTGEYIPDEAKKVATETLAKVGEVLNDLG